MSGKYNVLIVDDDRGDRKSLQRACEESGLSAHYFEAEDIPSALRLLSTQAVDCILMDYALPGEDGLSGLAKIHQDYPYTPTIMVTGQGDEIIASNAFKIGAADYLSKAQISNVQLRDEIEAAVQKIALKQEVDEQRADLERFADMMAHDLLSPIVHISNFADIMDDDIQQEDYTRLSEHLRYIKRSARNLSRLVKTLASYAQAGKTVEMQQVELNTAVHVARDMLEADIAEKSAEIHCEALPVVWGNQALLGQLFQNLIANAIKFNKSDQAHITISARPQGENVQVRFQDNGIGIPEEQSREIFKPFKRLHGKNEYSGSGLGLATVERIVKRHGGRIWVESEPGSGASFIFELPTTKKP